MKKSGLLRLIAGIVIVGIISGTIISVRFYNRVYKSNINCKNQSINYLFIPSGSDLKDVVQIIDNEKLLMNLESFEWLARKKNYQNHVYPGRYRLDSTMNNNDLINKLRSGYQEPVKVVFNSIRTREQLAAKISLQIEADSLSLAEVLSNDSFAYKYGLKPETFMCIFLPNTYEFWWNTSAEKFVERMYNEYKNFWNEDRTLKAESLNLTPEEVITLASIVDEESYYNDEMPRVAGVYINRLRKRMHLQADPTLKFALGDFSIKRVLNVHKQIDSPYNTYKRYGLPPGPISIPSVSAIDAVLNYENHSYIYFCAKPDFSGYHNFAKTLSQHNVNARNYQRALNKERIWR
ncbi:MAG: endolytic transglycosylase MltG [Bacteroidales bacterium]|nr:endolytic transglycosylase MltG [Bacteroidales bacterium]